MVKFYDTCSLLNLQQKIFDDYFYISTISLQELENIKTSGTRDEEIRWAAREITSRPYGVWATNSISRRSRV